MVDHVMYTELEPQTGPEYEEMVKKLLAFLHSECDGLEGVEVKGGRTNLIRGKSGFEHQIDVSIRLPGRLLIVECKFWAKKVGVEAVLALAARQLDLQEQEPGVDVKASIVSTQFVTRGAELTSQYFGVQLDQVDSFEEYSLTFGSRHFVGLLSKISITDSIEAEVTKRPPEDPEGSPQE